MVDEATDALTCLVLMRGGFRDCGMAKARLRAPLGGDGGGYDMPVINSAVLSI